ncbi:MAG TPA: HepT-like ribonuclease domain-containing protein [Acetobacteraceae bacterium]|nr:HepT-like ribonuclease domain-containing protein [Acetobacteraceae bacterium]
MRTLAARLSDIIEAIERIRTEAAGIQLDAFEADWRKQWLIERGVEVISEASRHLTDEMKARHPGVPWRKIAGVGNILRHEYDRIAADVLWRLAQDELALLEEVCRSELTAEQERELRQ